MAIEADVESVLRAKFAEVLPHLDERAARLVLAGEARSLAQGGSPWWPGVGVVVDDAVGAPVGCGVDHGRAPGHG